MSVDSATELVELLRRLRLLEPPQLEELTRSPSSAEPQSLARDLVRRGWLTPYQVNQTFTGRGQDLLLGSYVLLEKLGEGGMGQVFKARNWKLGRVVAIKLIRKDRLDNPEAVRRFHREIRAAAQLDHPNIVRALDADEFNGTQLLVMEYVEGADLAKVVKRQGPLPIALACDYARQAALGLQHAHEKGLVHRDVKPPNLLVTPESVVKILDMGLARLLGPTPDGDAASTMTQEGMIMGTPDYIAPEQAWEAHDVDCRADVYSLGCTLYQLLTGKVPYPTGTFLQKLNQHQHATPTPVEALRPDLRPEAAAVVRKLMARRREDRYQTPAEAAAALGAVARLGGAEASAGDTASAIRPLPGAPADCPTAAHTPGPAGERTAPESATAQPHPQATAKPARRPAAGGTRRLIYYGAGGLLSLALAALFLGLFLGFASPPVKAPDEPRAAAPSDPRLKVVYEELRKMNPKYDGPLNLTVEGGVVIGFDFRPDEASDLSPLKALRWFDGSESAGPDLAVQGEYVGDAGKERYGAQVIARGDGTFEVYFLRGGLPGDGWDGATRIRAEAATAGEKVALEGGGWSGTLEGSRAIKGRTREGAEFTLVHTIRASPTLGKKPPADAIVLFDGTNADAWDGGKVIPGDLLNNGVKSKRKFGSCTFHVEFRLPYMPRATSQARANSGVYVQDRWEIQVLDSFGLTGEDNECGGVYRQFKPLVNMCYPPLSWQTYDVDFTAARYDGDKQIAPAVLAIRHNGVLVQDRVKLDRGPTGGGEPEGPSPGPIQLQNHGGDRVYFRNIWVVEAK